MAAAPRPPAAASGRRHAKNISYSLPQRSLHDPLEAVDDPLAIPPSPDSSVNIPAEVAADIPTLEDIRPGGTPIDQTSLEEAPRSRVDLHFLLDRGKYHTIPLEDVPQPFLNSTNQPKPGTPLAELLSHGHFRRAAETALEELLQTPADRSLRVLQLLHTRLACLVLISRADLASHEAAALTDYLAHSATEANDVLSLVPWELRLLLVRLQTITAADGGRRSIMALYSLAGEVRARIKGAEASNDATGVAEWSGRLRDLGLRVADTLVEMGELETATRHLDTLPEIDPDELSYRIALLRLRVGDTTGAELAISKLHNEAIKGSLEAMLDLANGETSQAIDRLQQQQENGLSQPLLMNNIGVGMLYIGRITQAREVFEKLAEQSAGFAGLLFNLSTVYELCSERAGDQKMALAQQIADKPPAIDSGGWERAAFEFKL